MKTGKIDYQSHDRPPSGTILLQQYRRLFQVDRSALESKDPYKWGTVIESMLIHADCIQWQELQPYAVNFPANQFLLRSLRTYLDICPRRAAVPFLESHYQAIEKSQLEDHWRETYLKNLLPTIESQKRARK
ncbi:MAG: hypothetical protein B9S32_11570 [Verrucomicrobia bacterium Tous-C9LFEB]|nr:MAG: hypothetical protein B9S32_11570 [Verrucomicrobia bacterium Tous-C9LFEB]